MTSWLFGGSSFQSEFASCAQAFNRLNDAESPQRGAAAADLRERAKDKQYEDLGKGLHILMKNVESDDMAVIRCCLETLARCVELAEEGEETPYSVLLNREQVMEKEEWLVTLVELLTASDLWVRFWTLKVLLALGNRDGLPLVRGAILAAREGPRLIAETVKDSREAVRGLGVQLLTITARDCYPLAQLACYGGGLDDLLDAVEELGGLEGSTLASKCVDGLSALLEGNASNQAHFLLMKGVSRLAALLQLDDSDFVVLTDAKAEGLLAICRLIRVLTAWDEPQTQQMQQGLMQTSLGPQLVQMAVGRLPLLSVRLGALYALGYLVRNQGATLDKLSVGEGGKNAVARAVEVATNASVSAEEAQGCVFLLQCYFWNHVPAQLEYVSHWSDGEHLMAKLLQPALHEDHFLMCLLLARLFQNNASAQMAALDYFRPLMPVMLSLESSSATPKPGKTQQDMKLGQIGRLRLLYAVCSDNPEATTLFFGGETNNYVAKLVEAVISAHSDPHVAISSLVVLLALSAHHTDTKQLLLKRVGADKCGAVFRSVFKSKAWAAQLDQEQQQVAETVPANHSNLLYTAYSRRIFRQEFESLNMQFDLPNRGGGGGGSGGGHQAVEIVKLKAIISQLQEQLAAKEKSEAEAKDGLVLPPAAVEGEMSLELLKKRDEKINSLKLQVDQLQQENDKLLILLADQEMQITKLKAESQKE